MPLFTGTSPEQVPTNGDLGSMAFQSAEAIRVGGIAMAIKTVTTAYTIDREDHTILVDASAGAVTITLPAVGFGNMFRVHKIDSSANVVTVARQGSATILGTGPGTNTAKTLSTQWARLHVQGDGTNWYEV